MNLTYSEILYAFTRHNIDLREDWFKDDKDMVAFIQSLKSVPKEELQDIMTWNGVEAHVISKASFQNKLFTSLFTEKVNDLGFKQQTALKVGDWRYLQELFPEVSGLPRQNKLMTADQFPDDTVLYKPFFPEWDSVFYGLLPGDLIYLYSTPKMGKSVLAAFWAYKALANGYKVGFYNTELDTQTTQKAILGFNRGLKYNEALVFFQKYPHEFSLLKERFGQNLLMPPNLIFEWDLLEEMFKRCDLVVLDNQVSALATLGIEESPQSMGDITRKLSTMQKKHGKPFIIVTQEAARQATPKEIEVEPNILEYGTGTTRSSRACIQECFDKETEVLTLKGWKYIRDIEVGEKVYQYNQGKLELIEPTNYINRPYKGLLDKFTGSYIDMLTTPNHRHLVRDPFNNSDYEILSKDIKINKDHKFINTGYLEKSKGIDLSDNELNLLVATQADGHYSRSGIEFHLKRLDKIDRLTKLLGDINYFRAEYKDGSSIFRIGKDSILYSKITNFLPDKIITIDLINQLSTYQLKLVGEEIFKWDGCERKTKNSGIYQSVIKENVDSIQVLYSLIGQKTYQTHLDPEGNRQRIYQLYINHRNDTGLRTCTKTQVFYDDTVYCLTVPSSFLLVRRNGKVQVSGNCSLALRIVKQNSHSLTRKLHVVADRYRSKLDSMSSYEITINNRGEMEVEVMRDAIELAMSRAERAMEADPLVSDGVN